MKFEWDLTKAATNLRKHRVSFEEATRAFDDGLSATFPDPDHSLGEARFVTYGFGSGGQLLAVCHAERGATIRIVSARVATPKERKRYEA